MTAHLEKLIGIMQRLRDPERGCPWDVQQTFQSIAPYTVEEAYEVADAIDRQDMSALKEELGDLLFQVVFHARMAEEENWFDFDDVAQAICEKMIARHPHVFADDDQPMTARKWEDLKGDERAAQGLSGALDGVAKALPALLRAQKLQQRAARHGFDWPDADGPRSKVVEEMEELFSATTTGAEEEAGDFLFAAVNLVRAFGIDAETALRAGNAKFERRFSAMETLADGKFADLDIATQDRLWQEVKRQEASTS